MNQKQKIQKYIIRQVINGKTFFYKELYCTYDDYLAFKSLLLLPNEEDL